MPKVYEELAFVLENKQVPHNEMDALIENALASVDLNVTDNTFCHSFKWWHETKARYC